MSDFIEIHKLDIQDIQIALENAIYELKHWYLPELDMKQAKTRARKLQKVLDTVCQYKDAHSQKEARVAKMSYEDRKKWLTIDNAGVSYWLKDAIEANDKRDIADARADVKLLDDLLEQKFKEIMKGINDRS